MDRPIILSPPPLEYQHTQPSQPSQGLQGLPNTQGLQSAPAPQGLSRQQPATRQSVGFNLQHEFETLNADLDLDLKGPMAPARTAPSVVAPVPSQPLFLPPFFRLHTADGSDFNLELIRFTLWIDRLSFAERTVMAEHLAGSLSIDMLRTLKARIDAKLDAFVINTGQLSTGMESLHIHQPKPKGVPRPKSAEPSQFNLQYLDRAKSPTNHMFEKTSFLQLAAAQSPAVNDSLDMSQKLGALNTINLRVALDSSKKFHHYDPQMRQLNSSSVPVPLKKLPRLRPKDSLPAAAAAALPLQPSLNSLMPPEVTSLDLLNNIPAWLKLLRLHKYTDCLRDVPWTQLVQFDDEELERRGVRALGARRKLLKAFDLIRAAHG